MKRSAVLLYLALCPLTVSAQVRVGAAAEARAVPVTGPVVNAPAGITQLPLGVSLPAGGVSLSVAPAPSAVLGANAAVGISQAPLAAPAIGITPISAAVAVTPLAGRILGGEVTPSVAVQKSVVVPVNRTEKAAEVVRDEVASWGEERRPDEILALPSAQFAALAPARAAASAETPDDVPAPKAQAPNKGRPGLSKTLLISGAVLVGVSLTAAAAPALLPAALVAAKGALAWAGLGAMAASRFWREPGAAPDVPRGPPAPAGGSFSSFKVAWAAARDSAAAQKSFEQNVGGSSWESFKTWLLGALRTGLYWMAPSLLLMLGGAILAKAGMMLTTAITAAAAATPAAPAAGAAINTIPMSMLLMNFVPMALAGEAACVAVYFAVEKIAEKLGAGKASFWLGMAAALGLAAGVVLTLTHAPFIVAVTLALEAGVIWTAAKSRSFAAALSLRGILTMFSLLAAMLGAWLNFGVAGALVGLPAVWGGLAVGALALLAWKLKSPGLELKAIGEWWKTDEPGQKPKSPGRILSSGLVWGLVVYAIGDLTFWAVNAIAPGAEPAPAILAKMLTASVVLVLYNFVIVGVLEEYVFRRGLFKMMNDKFEKWGLTMKKAFWVAAIGSALIFSGVHYIDWGAIMAKIGMGDPAASSGLAGAYAFTWAGFVARSVLGVVLAGIYKRSGLILIPIVAHFWADSMEGLGLRWGFPAFLALAAGALLVSFFFKPKPKPS
ncbi:MAG: CPBP family intramembrane metalloprotease [Elusimicrobia bacterium]|nr:CPBP family intramembrane metalloprotease [Elusimicrobiota bacterium]